MQFFSDQYQSIGITPQITVREHLSLMIHLLLGSGAIAETPVLAYFLGRFGIITHQLLIEKARYAVVAIFLIAAIITPTPDVLTQCLFALPLLLLYGLSIGIVYIVAPQPQSEPPPSLGGNK
jgi:sec-independent protein translocase protein TatC